MSWIGQGVDSSQAPREVWGQGVRRPVGCSLCCGRCWCQGHPLGQPLMGQVAGLGGALSPSCSELTAAEPFAPPVDPLVRHLPPRTLVSCCPTPDVHCPVSPL